MYISSPSIPCTLHSTVLLLYSSCFFFLLAACRTLITIWIAIHYTALYFTLLEYTPPLSGMNVLMSVWMSEWMIKKKVRQPTRKQKVLHVCVCVVWCMRDGWDGNEWVSEWVRGIEEEEEEEAELAEVLLIDCVICCCWKKNIKKNVDYDFERERERERRRIRRQKKNPKWILTYVCEVWYDLW